MNHEIKALIADDEALACDMLEWLIHKNVPAITQVKKATSASATIGLVHSFQPQLLFLDIQMPFMNGFDILSAIPQHNFRVVFTTAYNKYAIKAIRFSALDYLLKPVDAEELKAAVNRYQQQSHQDNWQELHKNLIANLQQKESGHFKIALHTQQGIRLLQPDDILYCEGENNYTHFFLTDGTRIIVSKTIKEYEAILADHHFMRIHKSWLVNIKYINSLNTSNQVVLENGITLEVSRRKRSGLIELLKGNHISILKK